MPYSNEKIVLLGEAPKSHSGFAFGPESFTTQQIAAAIDVAADQLYTYFWLRNVFNTPLPAQGLGDSFPMKDAIASLRNMYFDNMNIICVGSRVKYALENALGIDPIPENDLGEFEPHHRNGIWHLGHIVHPAARNLAPDRRGLTLPKETRLFLRWAAGLSR